MEPALTPELTSLAGMAHERARAFAPFVLAGLVISVVFSGHLGVPLPVPVLIWNAVAILGLGTLSVALMRERISPRHGHVVLAMVWAVPVCGTLITQAFTGDPMLTYLLTIELAACGLLLRARWLAVAFVIVDVAWALIALRNPIHMPLFAGMIVLSEIIGFLFQRVYSGQIVRAETHRREQERTAIQLAAQLAELRRSEEDRGHLQEQLVHAQRMEAVGTLSAGLAHDMNNILGSIMSFAEIARDDIGSLRGDPRSELALIIAQAARGAELTRGLLAFSRHGQYRKKVVALDTIVREVATMLARTLPKSVELRVSLPEAPMHVAADPTQLAQVLVNLAVNAADAMNGSGVLAITASVDSDRMRARISVTDTGIGMDDATMKRVFEPFFTTKERGKGTGLGLSTVWGIVTGHDGLLDVQSTLGVGTTFVIRLPLTEERPTTEFAAPPDPDAVERTKVLVVDDEPLVRRGTRRILERKGYEILEAANGAEALEIFDAHAEEIGLVVLDMAMPVMGGYECFDKLRTRTDVPVLVTTGHTSDAAAQQMIARGAAFLEKPYPAADLVREAARLLRAS